MLRFIAFFLLCAPAFVAAQQGASNSTPIGVPLASVLSKLDARIYGRVKMDFNYDSAEFAKYNDFIGAVKAGEGYKNDSSNFNPRDTRFGLVVSQSEDDWLSEGVLETDFYGTNNGNNLVPRLRLGYVRVSHKPTATVLTAGQDWAPIGTLSPATIDFGIMAAGGNLWNRVPQLTVRRQFDGAQGEWLLSLMRARRQDTSEETRMPWLLAKVSHKFGEFNLGLGAGWKHDDVAIADQSQVSMDRYLAVAEAEYKSGPLTVAFEPWIGQGIDDDFYRYELGVNPTTGNAGEIGAWGGFLSASYAATELLTISLGTGLDNPRDEDLSGMTLGDRQFELNQHAFVNFWYQLTKSVKVGGEVMYIRTEREETAAEGWRFTSSTMLSF